MASILEIPNNVRIFEALGRFSENLKEPDEFQVLVHEKGIWQTR